MAHEQHGEIRFLGDLQRLQPQPGDVFVLRVPGRVPLEQADRIREIWKTAMGDTRLLILDSGMQLGCIDASKEPPHGS